MEGQAMKMLLIFIDENDTWGEARVPLYEAICEMLFQAGLSGATVHRGLMGFGGNRRLHRRGLFGVTDDRPVTITVVEGEDKLEAMMPRLRTMIAQGLVFLVDGQMLHLGLDSEVE